MPFPTTGLIDDFNRANDSTLGANWTADPLTRGLASCSITSNEASGVIDDDWYNAATYGPDCEAYVDLSVVAANVEIFLRVLNPGSADACDGYSLFIDTGASPDAWMIKRTDNDVQTTLGASVNQNIANGEKFGIEAIGSTIKGYHYTAGAWSEKISRTDATYNSAGSLAMFIGNSSAARMDNFSGGTVVAAAVVWPLPGLVMSQAVSRAATY